MRLNFAIACLSSDPMATLARPSLGNSSSMFSIFINFRPCAKATDQRLADIAEKALKEATYHLRFSSEWVVRLGDGTELSQQKMQDAVDLLWPFTGELSNPDACSTPKWPSRE
jgi:hypothetical protein